MASEDSWPPDRDSFLDHLTRDDPWDVVVRGHIWIETALNELLETLVPVPDELPKNLSFRIKVKLVVALGGLPAEDAKAYIVLLDLRNRLAHRLSEKVTPEDQRKLIAAYLPDPQLPGVDLTLTRTQFPLGLRICISMMRGALEAQVEVRQQNQGAT